MLTSKHHDGFTLWPSETPNPTLPAAQQHATRDLVGELTAAVRKQGMRMGLYYSGGYDWTFVPGPIRVREDYDKVKPQSEAYGKYADAHMRELDRRYQPAYSGMTSTIPSPAIHWKSWRSITMPFRTASSTIALA